MRPATFSRRSRFLDLPTGLIEERRRRRARARTGSWRSLVDTRRWSPTPRNAPLGEIERRVSIDHGAHFPRMGLIVVADAANPANGNPSGPAAHRHRRREEARGRGGGP